MKKTYLSTLSNIYIYFIGLSIIPVLFLTAPSIGHDSLPELLELVFWVFLEIAADLNPFRIMLRQQMDMTMSFAVQLAAVILLGTGKAVWVIIIATIIVEIISQRQWIRAFFNVGQYGLSIVATGFLYHLIKLSPDNIPVDIILDLPAILVAVSAFYAINTFFVSAVISLTSRSRLVDIFFSNFLVIIGYYYSLAPISIAASLLYIPHRPYIVLIMIPPLIMADKALRRYYSLQHEAQETLKVLAVTVDERDKYTFFHSINVAEYAKKIAEHLNLSIDEVSEIETAGQVHDLGKVGIPDCILNKESKLTYEEMEIIKKHPETAYRLLKNLKPYKKGAEYVLYHHEYYNGEGYPGSISGKDIPLGARILTVADSYDAMTTDRPYRKALPQSIAVEELVKCSGTQFDPKVVEAFIEVLKRDYGYKEDTVTCL